MAKTIVFTDPATERTYTLEYNRASVMKMEANGFYLNQEIMEHMPLTTLLKLFHGAFWLHHRAVKLEDAAEMMKRMTDQNGLIERLCEMYMEPVSAISGGTDETDEDNERKNLITWS